MSLIVVVKDSNRFYVGCDTRVSQGNYYVDTDYKLVRKAFFVDKNKGLIIGATGSIGCPDLVANIVSKANLTKLKKSYIIDEFWPIFIQRCKENGMMDPADRVAPGEVIIIMKDAGFYIDPAGGVMEILDTCSLGSGAAIADAVLYTIGRIRQYAPRTKIAFAIEAAAEVRSDISNEVYIGRSDGVDFARYRIPL